MRRIGVGIDFGTTNSAAATYDGERVSLIQLEQAEAIMQVPLHRSNVSLECLLADCALAEYPLGVSIIH